MTTELLNRFVPLIQVPHQNRLVPRCTEDPRTSWVTHHLSDSRGQNQQGERVTGHSDTFISAHRRNSDVTLVTSRLWPWKDWHIRPCFQSYTTTACRDNDARHSHCVCLNFASWTFTFPFKQHNGWFIGCARLKAGGVYLVTPTRNAQIWAQICHSVNGPLVSRFILHHLAVQGIIGLLSLGCPKHRYFRVSQD